MIKLAASDYSHRVAGGAEAEKTLTALFRPKMKSCHAIEALEASAPEL
jgi:hypothetical protein